MLPIEEQIEAKITAAQKERDEFKLNSYRFLKAAIQNERIAVGKDFNEADLLKLLRRELKKRQEALEAFLKGGRESLAAKERAEAELIKEYLPQELSDEQLRETIAAVIAEGGFTGPADFGKAMKEVIAKLNGQANGKKASAVLKEYLAANHS